MLPGIKTSVTFNVSPETGTDTGHTATSLIRPVGAANIDQAGGFVGTKAHPIGSKDGGAVGLLPIQIPVSPDGNYMLVANTSSGKIAVVDARSDTLVKYLPCDRGCHGVSFGAKKGGGYYGYVSNKFSNRMFAIDGDPNGDGNPADAAIVGSLVLNATGRTLTDDRISGLAGQGARGSSPSPSSTTAGCRTCRRAGRPSSPASSGLR